ncbi:NCS1 nucleoside transporter family [Pleurostoma richardsiae]|uniref:NCS1 nucleoside transporter family n=1 Tax=Pleurostoma richardsiae TaxID=41990 RepID=A0AA38R4M1_9PEZI|nr:NCS1 nucleoside transporter family [Pleurostoma richardsiae]
MEGVRNRAKAVVSKVHTRLTQPSSWAIPREESSIAPPGVWSSRDYDPVEPKRRIWTSTTIATYWFSDLVSIVGWSQAAAMYNVGLSATDATLATMVAGICISLPTVLSSRIGATMHIPFPIAIRASYGSYLHYFCVVSRAVLALFWFGIHSVYGSNCVTSVLLAIWPSYAHVPNHLPDSARITTQGMASYIIYHILQFPFLFVPPHKLKYLFRAKVVLLPPVVLGMAIWIACKAHGGNEFFYQPPRIHGAARAWQWLSAMTSVTGGCSTLALNISDWSRFSKRPESQWWQILLIPLFLTAMGICGIVGASASQKLYGEALWNPLDIVNKWDGSSGGRAAAFFCSFMWLLAQISINLSTNSVAFATDIGSLVPKWLNIRRASVLGFFLGGWALCPWIILESAETFLNFMSAYAIFMAPMTGVLLCDYYITKHRRYNVPELYNPKGIYYYKYGTNWRALVVTILTVTPLLPAIGNKVTPNKVHISAGLQHLYTFNWLYCFFLSFALYFVLNKLFPSKSTVIPEAVLGGQDEQEASDTSKETDGVEVKALDV